VNHKNKLVSFTLVLGLMMSGCISSADTARTTVEPQTSEMAERVYATEESESAAERSTPEEPSRETTTSARREPLIISVVTAGVVMFLTGAIITAGAN